MENGLRVILIAMIALIVLACAEKKEDEASNLDGATPEQAIVLGVFETSFEAVALEEEWIKINHNGAKVVQQDLIERDGRTLDMITLKMPDDSIRVIYFALDLTGGGDS